MEAEFKKNKVYVIANNTLEFAILLYLSCFAFGISFREAGLTLMIISLLTIYVSKRKWPSLDKRIGLPLLFVSILVGMTMAVRNLLKNDSESLLSDVAS